MMTPDALQPASFLPLHCGLDDISIDVEPGEPPSPTADMIDRWQRASAANPRLFNGPILRFRSLDAGSRTIRAARDTYQRYAMQQFDAAHATPDNAVFHLAVTGVVLGADREGRQCVLLGKRGGGVFVYPRMWELAPGGGLEGPDIHAQLLQEMEEELGLAGLVDGSRREELLEPGRADDVLGLSSDPNTPSVDIVVRVRLREGVGLPGVGAEGHAWEYGAMRLVRLEALPEFAASGASAIIPPTLAIWRGLGWIP